MRPAKTQISLGIRPVWSESSLSAWRNLGSLATHWAHSEDSDQTGRMPRQIWVFAGRTLILLVLSCRCSFLGHSWLDAIILILIHVTGQSFVPSLHGHVRYMFMGIFRGGGGVGAGALPCQLGTDAWTKDWETYPKQSALNIKNRYPFHCVRPRKYRFSLCSHIKTVF